MERGRKPFISILTATYNRAEYLKRAYLSILANSKFGEIEKTIETILSGDNLERMVLSRDYNKNSDLAELVSDFKKLVSDISLQLKEKESVEKLDLIEKACREKMDSVK